MNPLAVIVNLIFPGIGLVLAGRRLAGIVFATVFCAAIDGIILSPLLVPGKPAASFVKAFAMVAAVVWVWSLARLAARIRFLRSPAFIELKEKLFWEGMEHYLKNQLGEAREAFARLLALDGEDADAHLYLGLVYKGLGQRARARVSLKRCLRFDYRRKWRWEVEGRLQELKGGKA